MSHLSFSLLHCCAGVSTHATEFCRTVFSRMSRDLLVSFCDASILRLLLLSTVGPPCLSIAMHTTSDESFEASLPHLPWSSRAPNLSLHALSSQACHLLEVRTIMFWTLRFCIPLLLSWDFGFDRACIRSRPSWTSGVTHKTHLTPLSSTYSLCGTSSRTSAPTSLCCSVTLGCSDTLHFLQQHFITCPPAVARCSVSIPGSQPWLFLLLHVHLARVSSTTSNDFNANFSLRITAFDPSMEPGQF